MKESLNIKLPKLSISRDNCTKQFAIPEEKSIEIEDTHEECPI